MNHKKLLDRIYKYTRMYIHTRQFTTLILFCFFNMLFGGQAFSQRKNNPTVLAKNGVSEVKVWSYVLDDGQVASDSSHIVTRRFNKKGSEVFVLLHDSVGVKDVYEYIYDKDGVTKLESIYYSGYNRTYRYTAKLAYDRHGRTVKTEKYRYNKKMKSGSISKYNDAGQLEKIYFKLNGDKVGVLSYAYGKEDNLVSSQFSGIKQSPFIRSLVYNMHLDTWVVAANGHGPLYPMFEYDELERQTRFDLQVNEAIDLLGISEIISLGQGQQLSIRITYDDLGLIKNKYEYIDGVLSAYTTYDYSFF